MTRIKKQQGLAPLLLLALTNSVTARPDPRAMTVPEHFISSYQRTYDPASPSETCYEKLHDADADGDGLVQSDEYISFVSDLSEEDYNVDSYIDLPFVLKVNFVYLSCLCRFRPENDRDATDCCKGTDGGIYISGADPNVIPLEWEEAYLNTVCSETQGAIEYARIEDGLATAAPTVSPTTLAPSNEPTAMPTKQPSEPPVATADPSQSPTPKPVTDSPTLAPSVTPTTSAPTPGQTTISPVTPTKQPSLASPAPTTEAPSTKAPSSGTDAPTPTGTTKAPIIGTPAPTTKAPISGTPAPTAKDAPTTKAPSTGSIPPTVASVPTTGAPSTSPTTKSPSGTDTPSSPPEPTTSAPVGQTPTPSVKPTDVSAPTVPSATPLPTTKAPTPGGTQFPSVSLRPTATVPVTSPTPDNNNPGNVEAPDGGGGEGTQRSSESLSPGGIAGIIIASAFVVYAAAYIYATRRKREVDDPSLEHVANKDMDDLEAGNNGPPQDDGPELPTSDRKEPPAGSNVRDSGDSDAAVFGNVRDSRDSDAAVSGLTPNARDSGDSGAATYQGEPYDAVGVAEYTIPQTLDSTPPSPSQTTMPLVSGMPSPGHKHNKSSDSSSAGESGWSSSAGFSSLNTASFDAGAESDGLLPGSPSRLLATLSAANSATETADSVQRDSPPLFLPVAKGKDEKDPSPSSSSQASVDSAMEAIASTPLKIHGESGPTPAQGKVTREDLNAAIEAGDWAVVGATAALLADSTGSFGQSDNSLSGSEFRSSAPSDMDTSSYISASDASDSNNRTRELDRMVETGDWEGVVLAAAQFEGKTNAASDVDSHFTEGSEALEGSKRREEIREEVEKLVKRVVPDEMDNIDEMMLQFEGREEELIETLRTMQERSVAQRARAAVQKTAKLEARAKASIASGSSIQSSVSGGPRTGDQGSLSTGPSYYGSANDSSVSDYEGYHDAEGSMESSVSDLGFTSEDASSRRSGKSSLELAIERGDWRAVGEAAAMMGEGSAAVIPDDNDGSLSSSFTESHGKQDRVSHLDALIAKGDWAGIVAAAGTYQAIDDQGQGTSQGSPTEEEREALAQADMWQTIANQSKQDSGAEAEGAATAADWAIQRSLEEQMNPKTHQIEDDQSV